MRVDLFIRSFEDLARAILVGLLGLYTHIVEIGVGSYPVTLYKMYMGELVVAVE